MQKKSLQILGAVASVSALPTQYNVTIDPAQMMPAVDLTFQTQTIMGMQLANNAFKDTAFVKGCTQSLTGATVNCEQTPTFVTTTLDKSQCTGVGVDFTHHDQGGFTMDGTEIVGDFLLYAADGSVLQPYTNTIYGTSQINDDAWTWGNAYGAGEIAVGINSTTIQQLGFAGSSGYLLETGPVTDQSFAGGAAPGTNASLPNLFIGFGDYNQYFSNSDATTITLSPDGEGAYTLVTVGFGKTTFDVTGSFPQSGFYQPLGYPGTRPQAIIATNFVGLGLPSYLWYQVTNLLYKVDLNFDDNIICDNSVGGKCQLSGACSSYTNLWTAGWSFKVQFQGATDYILFPLGALAEDDTTNGVCNIYI